MRRSMKQGTMDNINAYSDELLNLGIKDLMERYPAVREVLKKYNFICAMCSVGVCKLPEIAKIHGLSEAEGHELIRLIKGKITRSLVEDRVSLILKRLSYEPSPSLKLLVERFPWIRTLLESLSSTLRVAVLRAILMLTSGLRLERRVFRYIVRWMKG